MYYNGEKSQNKSKPPKDAIPLGRISRVANDCDNTTTLTNNPSTHQHRANLDKQQARTPTPISVPQYPFLV